ncbi:MAG: hypothetical protein LBI57_05290 [Helicobacteraceae bacterium]|jgi:hypothetical protein|nr:hypothetical protein [Helicobacteraceae bacterium]
MPNYRDIQSVSNASPAESENKLLELIAGYEDNKARLKTFNLIAMKTISDFGAAGSSKLFRVGLETNANDRLSPFFEWGRGLGVSPFDGAVVYITPRIGFAQGRKANPFAAVEVGAIARIAERAKALMDYARFYDADDSYRGFKGEFNARVVFAPSYDYDLSLACSRRFEGGGEYKDRFAIGASFYF